MSIWQARLYWALIGTLFGLGSVSFFSVGIPLLLLGAILLLYPASRKVIRSDSLLLWIAIAAMGFAPAVFLMFRYVVADHSSEFFGSGYLLGVLLLAAIGLAGIVGGIITMAHRQLR